MDSGKKGGVVMQERSGKPVSKKEQGRQIFVQRTEQAMKRFFQKKGQTAPPAQR